MKASLSRHKRRDTHASSLRMAADGNSFLPRLRSVFYARFDETRGTEIAYQVPEGLITSCGGPISSGAASPVPSGSSRASSRLAFVHPERSESRVKVSPQKSTLSSAVRTLFNFEDVSKYIIAQSPLCGRLVTCTAGNYKVLGFPVELMGKYQRNYFRFNVCFVFDASADLSCYEPIVRKVNRVMTACEVSLHLSWLASKYIPNSEGRVVVPVVPRNIIQDPCDLGAALRGFELLFGNVNPSGQFQLHRTEDIPILPKSASSQGLDGARGSYQL